MNRRRKSRSIWAATVKRACLSDDREVDAPRIMPPLRCLRNRNPEKSFALSSTEQVDGLNAQLEGQVRAGSEAAGAGLVVGQGFSRLNTSPGSGPTAGFPNTHHLRSPLLRPLPGPGRRLLIRAVSAEEPLRIVMMRLCLSRFPFR